MTKKDENLIWIDLEMTGLDLGKDRILEIATIITDSNLNLLEKGPVMAIHQSEELLRGMDDWNQKHHGQSGLINRVKESQATESSAEAETLHFLSQWVPAGKSPMCGNSICQDRRFLYKYMPKLESYFHYRNLDVTTLKILVQRWTPALTSGLKKNATHQALQDVMDSIEELKYYRQHFIRI